MNREVHVRFCEEPGGKFRWLTHQFTSFAENCCISAAGRDFQGQVEYTRAMMKNLQAQVEKTLLAYNDPYLNTNLVAAQAIKQVVVDQGNVHVDVELGFPAKSYYALLQQTLASALKQIDGVNQVHVQVDSKVKPHLHQLQMQAIAGVKNIIAIASAKGGVGKSTVAVNVASALAVEGAKVGLLDADIYGPSQPTLLGVHHQPEVQNQRRIEPIEVYGLQTMSIGYLIPSTTPAVWRGPMVSKALQQLLLTTHWQDLDYLIIDLPPGTGDIQLTLVQRVPVTGAVIVTTPQELAVIDARKGLEMFRKVDVPVLGLVENMSSYLCSACGHEEYLFGSGGGAQLASQCDVRLLASLPLRAEIRAATEAGKPIVFAKPDDECSQMFRQLALAMAAELSLRVATVKTNQILDFVGRTGAEKHSGVNDGN